MPNILVTTLGTTWQVVPELLGFTNPDLIDLYAYHSRRARFRQLREEYDIRPVSEIWVVTTEGERTERSVQALLMWHDLLDPALRPCLRVWKISGVRDLSSERECRLMSEAVLRIVVHTSERAGQGQLVLSLAGGRKTMSSDMQTAGTLFGCHALLHVIESGEFTAELSAMGPEDFLEPLPTGLKEAVTPLVVGRYEPHSLLEMESPAAETTEGGLYPVELPPDRIPVVMGVPDDAPLAAAIAGLQKKAGFLYCNYLNEMLGGEGPTNFLALYSLPKETLDRLKTLRMGVDPRRRDEELAWLKRLPKAELHCHLGGVAAARELIAIAASNRGLVQRNRDLLAPWLREWRRQLESRGRGAPQARPVGKEIVRAVPGVPEPACMAAFILLFEQDPERLDEFIYGRFREEGSFCGIGFETYETLGDFQGSGLLQSEQSLRAACRVLAEKAAEHHVLYLELRCSPANYVRGGMDPARVVRVVDEALSGSGIPHHALIFTASRHGSFSRVWAHVELAEQLLGEDGTGLPVLRGFDLAGNERTRSASAMRESLMSMMEKCMHFTVHAGENEAVDSIWEAVYHLSAERIGHGLTLRDNPALLAKFRDRGIALEMCPSSNFQIVGYGDNYLPGTRDLPVYPLKAYLDAGLRVTVNTDNPGISRTDFTQDLHRAARMTPGGLSLWEILILVRNGFKASFAEPRVRNALLRRAESQVLSVIGNGLPPRSYFGS